MKCIRKWPAGRQLVLTELPAKHDGITLNVDGMIEPYEIEITYAPLGNRVNRAIMLDNVIIPAIIKALNDSGDGNCPSCGGEGPFHCPACDEEVFL